MGAVVCPMFKCMLSLRGEYTIETKMTWNARAIDLRHLQRWRMAGWWLLPTAIRVVSSGYGQPVIKFGIMPRTVYYITQEKRKQGTRIVAANAADSTWDYTWVCCCVERSERCRMHAIGKLGMLHEPAFKHACATGYWGRHGNSEPMVACNSHDELVKQRDGQCHVESTALAGKTVVPAVQLMKQASRRIQRSAAVAHDAFATL
ncbi:predicted protein [Pyrenophora tritici-repentis Pt-1C-BFP]|uniref:Uncharacterized protein n=1 Tax=Pyrenophora tritici-repentis (strain Pt-1C-BFP) TaxID=426418 RepID=B2W9W4_PYRTR|nr:uncharacterized protein PTRG_06772 [Pyrenophora tritici-repentis Pt-1C-BFP]EDU49692.1 predicted protein [Pyrenophora tritici-repentis Pt-1C-BFP]